MAEQLEFFPIRARAGVFVRSMNADIAAGACVPAMSVLTGKTLATRKSRRCYASADSVFCAKYAQTKRVRLKNPSNLHFFNTVIAYTHDITSLRKMLWFSELPCPPGARILPFCDGLLAPDGLEYVPLQLASFIEEHLDLGITTVDHADIYGGYQCEAAFGEALKLVPALRDRMEIVTKCGIATTANLNMPSVITSPTARISSRAPSSRWSIWRPIVSICC